MRVSTMGSYLSGLSLMQRMQSAIDHTQKQISTGQTLLSPSDDPIAATRALELREALAGLAQFDRNAVVAKNRLSQEDSSLSSVNNVLQRVRELALQANNATQSNETRSLIAVEMREHLDQLMQIANQTDGNGRYLFAGNQQDVAPVAKVGGTYNYNGDQGQRMIAIGPGRLVADSDAGDAVFFRIRSGNGDFVAAPDATNSGSGIIGTASTVDPSAWVPGTYSVEFIDATNFEVRDSLGVNVASGSHNDGEQIEFLGVAFELNGDIAPGDRFIVQASPYQDMFSSIDKLATALAMPVAGDTASAAQTNVINAELRYIDQAIGNVLDIRTQVGSRLAGIESQVDSNASQALISNEVLAGIEDLDYAEALSRLSQQMTTLEAAQKSFVATQQLSLFDYL
ncbi:MAG TPA: flagellar hook-associated protein FlgL [Woeseiaceae bacterium]|nr:flagellar hook-associated protein FlgL [Woeseiaceae bacterium]